MVRELVAVLTLVVVDVETVDHIDRVDEELGTPHRLDEVTGSLHFCHKFDEELGASIGVDALHEPINGADETTWIGKTSVVSDWWVDACHRIGSDGRRIHRCAS